MARPENFGLVARGVVDVTGRLMVVVSDLSGDVLDIAAGPLVQNYAPSEARELVKLEFSASQDFPMSQPAVTFLWQTFAATIERAARKGK